jgi:hypothetical protein
LESTQKELKIKKDVNIMIISAFNITDIISMVLKEDNEIVIHISSIKQIGNFKEKSNKKICFLFDNIDIYNKTKSIIQQARVILNLIHGTVNINTIENGFTTINLKEKKEWFHFVLKEIYSKPKSFLLGNVVFNDLYSHYKNKHGSIFQFLSDLKVICDLFH